MQAKIRVLHPGLYTSIQDLGRFGFGKFGVPQSGVMDSYSAKIANLLLNNSEDSPVLEITQMGPKLQFSEATLISICGAFINPKLNGNDILNNTVIVVKKDDLLSFGKLEYGCRAYVGVFGGFKIEHVLRSASWYEGITAHYKLNKGDELIYTQTSESANRQNSGLRIKTDYIKATEITVFKGPEFDMLSKMQQQHLYSSSFTIDIKNNRMAVQLQEGLSNKLKSIITGPVLPGTVQLTPAGNLIVLMRDCQTTGGYPRILQVSEDGINTLAQKVLGDQILFELIEI
tara:strand:- start:1346 stop:2206 length:861 start_codon:yes stop_codon:yes gene_type:complete